MHWGKEGDAQLRGALKATTCIVHKCPGARVVLVSIQDDPGIKRRGRAAGALGYVGKYTADRDLLPAVRAALLGERFEGTRASHQCEPMSD
jgi:DNA-binding NarL/FixJ family response regulator